MNKLIGVVFISFLFFSFPLKARTPENLAGTDIFTDIDLSQIMPIMEQDADALESSTTDPAKQSPTNDSSQTTASESDQSQRSTPTPKAQFTQESAKALPMPQVLALSNLNLCFGAELFVTGVAQALYLNGDIIRQVKEEDENGKTITTTCFYKDIINKKPLTYEKINPLALLMRIFFYQTPGTSSLANFKVSEGFRFKDEQKTLSQWASFVAIAVQKTYEFEQGLKVKNTVEDVKSFIDVKNALHCKVETIANISLTTLINDCIKYAQKNNLGTWFVVRLLMAGTYELFGMIKY